MVSIILCTYNRASLVARAINSVVKQSYHDWELIVIDDGSTDSTREIIKRVSSSNKKIRYYYQSNKGLAKARNAGLKKANGEFITFIDSDDEYAKNHLVRRVEFLTNHREISMIHGGVKLIGPKEKHFVVNLNNPRKKIHLSKCHIGGTFFMRYGVIKKIKKFNAIPFGEDFDFYSRAEKYFRVERVTDKTYRYYLDAENRLCDVFTKELMEGKQLKKRRQSVR